MKKLFVIFSIILIALCIGFLIHQDSGYVLVAYGKYTVETSLWFAIISLLVLFLISYVLLRITKNTRMIGGKYKLWDKKRKEEKARELTNQGLCDLAEGNWLAAQSNLKKAAKNHPNPLINHLAAARAAQSAGNYDARDEHLRNAHKTTKGAEIAIGLTQATLQMEGRQWEQAIATLNHLNSIVPNHKHILKLLCDVHLELKDWQQLQKLLPALRRTKIVDEAQLDDIEKQIHVGLLSAAAKTADLTKLQKLWETLPKKWHQDAHMLTLYTTYLIEAGNPNLAAELIVNLLKKTWDVGLINNYGLAITDDIHKQISTAEKWLEKHPGEPELLLCLGRLCLKGKFYARAEHVLETCIAASNMSDAYVALGQVYEAENKPNNALGAYKKAVD